ncbi:peptidase [Palaeococcus pacificus DY20341]|uniref:Peptidase n=1 Tax=Palaeococcus pacificus DY20341 TaxID=1343739 RepID=A0A075LQL1_9EURY|nr:signal peptide peptidase SppA [Palaeococcus pacificus]AIF69015.1 peptidase [Palaeococcus pacificus DY20341]
MNREDVWKYLSFILTLLLALAIVSNVLLYMQTGELQKALTEENKTYRFEVQVPNVTIISNDTALQAKITELQGEIEYLKELLRKEKPKEANGTIVILPIMGPIDDYMAKDIITKIKEIEQNQSIGGVLLWIESPGGYVGPVRLIYKEVKKLSYKIPVVAYTGSLANSGGYYIACAADKIIADPLADVGSIGVIYVHYDLEQNYAQNGIKVNVFKTGKYKDMGAEWRDLTDEEKKMITDMVNVYFEEFLNVVSEGRKLDMNTTKEYATGRSWFATDVKGVLVDDLGDLNYAIKTLENLMNVSSAKVIFYDANKIDFGIYQSSSLFMPAKYAISYTRG